MGLMRGLRTWCFALAFVCIGLEARFRDLVSMDEGRPAIAILLAQWINIVWTLVISWLLFGGTGHSRVVREHGCTRFATTGDKLAVRPCRP